MPVFMSDSEKIECRAGSEGCRRGAAIIAAIRNAHRAPPCYCLAMLLTRIASQ
jgi:hypothetical protein